MLASATVTSLKPFWRYYGGKWRAAPRYPQPLHSTIVEPFAGAAGYSLRYPDRKIVLVEKYEVIAEMWRYLIAVRASEVRRIPCVDHVDDLPKWVPQGARSLVGFSLNAASTSPCKVLSSGRHEMRSQGRLYEGWTEHLRDRVAHQVELIRHWRIIEGDYTEAPNIRATWFVDPPYNNEAGQHYVHHQIDYSELASWTQTRKGQVMACEQAGATWLPFRHFGYSRAAMDRQSHEVLWDSCIASRPDTRLANMSDKLTQLFERFVSEARQILVAEAQAALGLLGGGGEGHQPSPRGKPGPKPKGAAPAAKAAAPGKRARRSPEDLEKQQSQILSYIKKNPASKAEHIGKALGLTSIEMQIPIANLLAEKSLKKAGERRATAYTAK